MVFNSVRSVIKKNKKTWLITGAAGFIGSHLAENLLRLNQNVVGIDNYSSGSPDNLLAIECGVGTEKYSNNFTFVEGDIRDFETCQNICRGVDYVLHHAVLGSVARSFEIPLETHESNVTGTLNLMWASVESKVQRFVYASSSSVYGDCPAIPNKEDLVGMQLSPYAVSKYVCELYARNFYDAYQLETIGLRYYNIYGPRQSVNGSYAAVIPCFVRDMLSDRPVQIHGDGKTSRDFCFVDNVVQANLLSAITDSRECFGRTFNVSSGEQVSILELYQLIKNYFNEKYPHIEIHEPDYRDPRPGEVRHSLGDISQIVAKMKYEPSHLFAEGLAITLDWYIKNSISG